MNDSLKKILEIAEKAVRKNDLNHVSDLIDLNETRNIKLNIIDQSIIKNHHSNFICKRNIFSLTDKINSLCNQKRLLEKYTINEKKIFNEALDAHNECREKHGAEPLKNNSEIALIAQQYAEQMAKSGQIVHSKNKYMHEDLGENIYSFDFRDPSFSGRKITYEWYNEIYQYKFMGAQYGTGHFTQLVWRSTKEVGFGISFSSNGRAYFVANYFPSGNVIGKFTENINHPLN